METDGQKKVDAGDHQSPKELLERQKLLKEIELLDSQLGVGGSITRQALPLLSLVLTMFLGISSIRNASLARDLDAMREKRTEDVKTREAIEKYFEWASADKSQPERRINGIALLASHWGDGFDYQIAELLSVLLASDDAKVRNMAAESIEKAITTECRTATIPGRLPEKRQSAESIETIRKRVKILYGSAKDWEFGSITRIHHFLRQQRVEQSKGAAQSASSKDNWCLSPTAPADMDGAIWATKEAIRKNWECLEDAYLINVDLSDTELYEANMAGADLRGANLRAANLARADLTSVNFEQIVDVNCANIRDAANEKFIAWAKSHGAVEMADDDWRRWKQHGFPRPENWEAWKSVGYPMKMVGL